MGQFSRRLRAGAALVAVVVLIGVSPQAQPAKLKHLDGIGELKAWFNANTAHARSIILLSPT